MDLDDTDSVYRPIACSAGPFVADLGDLPGYARWCHSRVCKIVMRIWTSVVVRSWVWLRHLLRDLAWWGRFNMAWQRLSLWAIVSIMGWVPWTGRL